MFRISTSSNKPDANRLKKTIEDLMVRGIKVGNVVSTYNFFSDMANSLSMRLKCEYGIENPNSPKQIEQFFIRSNNSVFYSVCFQDGKWTSNQEVLQDLKSKGYEFADILMKYRKAKKLADSSKSLMQAADKDGLIHPIVSLTKTNRISYTNPALMNIPKKLLWDVITPRNAGNVLWSVDIKNQEPSILINILGAPKLKEALTAPSGLYEHMYSLCFEPKVKCNVFLLPDCENEVVSKQELIQNEKIPPVMYSPSLPECAMRINGADIITIDTVVMRAPTGKQPTLPEYVDLYTNAGNIRAKVIWPDIPAKELGKPKILEVEGTLVGVELVCEGVYRKEFKTAWNAMTYGSSKRGIMEMCKHIPGEKVYNFFYSIPQMKQYQKIWKQQAEMGVQYSKTVFGTLLYANKPDTRQLARSLMDLPIQGTGADILDLLIDHFYTEIGNRQLEGLIELYYTRHDEAIVEVNGDWQNQVGADYVKSVLQDIFEHQIDDWTPFRVDIEPVKNELVKLVTTDMEED